MNFIFKSAFFNLSANLYITHAHFPDVGADQIHVYESGYQCFSLISHENIDDAVIVGLGFLLGGSILQENLFGIKQCLHFCVVSHLYEQRLHEPEKFSPLFLFLLKHSDVLCSPSSFTRFTPCVVHVSTRACHLHLHLRCKIQNWLGFCIHQRGFCLSPNKTWTLMTFVV